MPARQRMKSKRACCLQTARTTDRAVVSLPAAPNLGPGLQTSGPKMADHPQPEYYTIIASPSGTLNASGPKTPAHPRRASTYTGGHHYHLIGANLLKHACPNPYLTHRQASTPASLAFFHRHRRQPGQRDAKPATPVPTHRRPRTSLILTHFTPRAYRRSHRPSTYSAQTIAAARRLLLYFWEISLRRFRHRRAAKPLS